MPRDERYELRQLIRGLERDLEYHAHMLTRAKERLAAAKTTLNELEGADQLPLFQKDQGDEADTVTLRD